MNSQLERIKKKDYAALDNQLLMNMTSIQTLNSTVSNLKELQAIMDAMEKNNQSNLKQQKHKRQTIKQKTKPSNIAQNQQIAQKCEHCQTYQRILQKIPQKIHTLKDFVNETMKQLPNILSGMKHQLNNLSRSYRQMILEFSKIDKERQELHSQVEIILQTNKKLHIQKQKLEKICDDWQKARQRRRSNRASKENIAKYLQTQDLSHIPKMPFPLTKKTTNQFVPQKLQLKKILEDKTIELEAEENKMNSQRLSKSIHALRVNSSRNSLEKLSKQLAESNSFISNNSKNNLLLQKKGLKVTSEFNNKQRQKMQNMVSKC